MENETSKRWQATTIHQDAVEWLAARVMTPLLLGLRHHVALERLAAQALTGQDFISAFKFADRRCRIAPPPAAHCFVLRAEAAWRLGRQEAALTDLSQALAVAPSDVGANRRMLAWASDGRRRAAAANLIAHDSNPASLRAAIAELRRVGEHLWAAFSVFDKHITGWVAWTKAAAIEVSLATEDGTLTSLLETNPFHPLASIEVQASTFLIRRPPSRIPQTLILKSERGALQVRRLAPNLSAPASRSRSSPTGKPPSVPTIIVPVYRDVRATIDCFESLVRASANAKAARGSESPFCILAVDDASPEEELRRYLNELADAKKINLLVNAVNLGFVGAVNRALRQIPSGDVVLLNSDTIVPPGFVDRLTAVAHSASKIGTVTPLSNNGDIFSFPKPNDVNPMPNYEEVLAIDRVASVAKTHDAVDVPSGIGFCLYITRECLDSVGELSEKFERGYLEDVDLCLRARAKGFRNVCAPSVYVGHHGSKSFQHEKRDLVLRNLGILDQRFPDYRKECRAFATADPLRPARTALERVLPWPAQPSVLIVGDQRTCAAVTEERVRHLNLHGERATLLLRARDVLHLKATDGSVPQSVDLSLGTKAAMMDAAEILGRLRIQRVEIIDPHPLPEFIDLVQQLELPINLWLMTGMIGEAASSLLDDETPLFVPSKAAKAFAQARCPGRKIVLNDWPTRPLTLPPISTSIKSLAVVPSAQSPASLRVIRRLAVTLQRRESSRSIVVAGATCDDDRLMSCPNLFITGPVMADDLGDVLAPHNPGWLLTDFDRPMFGHPLIETTRRATRPVAYRDWSGGSLKPRRGDLAIPANVDEAGLIAAVVDWVTRT